MYSYIPSPTASFIEIYQDSDLKFACCHISKEDKSIRQLHDFVKCRDFLNDVLIATRQKKKSKTIYGFSFDGVQNPINLSRFEMLIRGDDFSLLKDNLKIFNDFETKIGCRKTVLKKVKGQDKVKLLIASPLWLRSTVLISFYTHIIRALYQYKPLSENDIIIKTLYQQGNLSGDDFITFLRSCGNRTGNAGSYQKTINKIDFEKLLRNARKVFLLKNASLSAFDVNSSDIQNIHDNGGIVSFCGKTSAIDNEAVERFNKL